MKSSKLLALSAITLLGFSACQKPELESELTSGATHTVTFVAGAPETKTTVDISDGASAKFAWTAADENRIAIYENGVAATTVLCGLDAGKMTIMATFEGSTPENASYVAVANSSNDGQIMSAEAYDEDADILVSKAVSSFDGENGVQLQFKREVAIAKMTLKGLDAGEVVNMVTVSSTADIAGSYGVEGWASPAKTALEISSALYMGETDGYSIVANEAGEAVVWFTCIPQTDATLTVKVDAADGDTYTKEFSKPITLTRGDVKGFGVAMTKDVVAKPWEAVELADIDETMPLVITMATKEKTYALSLTGTDDKALGTSKAPKAIEVSVVDGKLSEEPGSDILWNIANKNGNLTIYPNGVTAKWLYTTDGNDGVRLGTNTTNGYVWSIDATSGYLKANATSSSVRYLGVYVTGPDWRAYTNTTGNTADQTLRFYSNASTKAAIATPTNLAVSDDKVVSWDAVDGAASYVLTIGTEEYPCTSNSYDASAIADEYYDVAVVAVPTDTENYKNSAAATLTDAKFGTPTLTAPTLKEGAIDEFSVNTTWTVDSRATSGYNCELYNGETKVGDSQTVSTGSVTFDGLDDGVTYTVKVNAIAVEGTKAYAASDVATIDLTTTPASKVSDVTAADTYTIKNLTVYAVPNTSLAILGDATGYILYYAKGHGLSVGNTLDVAGTVVDYYGLWEFSGATASNVKTGSTPDYGEPVEATNEFLASFATKPLIKYIHAVGEQSGQDITVGENKLHLSAANSSTDGKTVTVYGFTYGYHSTNKYVQFVATSIAEDPTAPKLSVTPTSKTWASEETDAAVFTVTTNTEGEKDWSVSPTTLDWATIAIDETAGTITVTPNNANTTETAREATLTVSHSAGTLSETITLIQKAAGASAKVEKTATITFGTNDVKINAASVTANDDCSNSWTITTVGTTSFTAQPSYYQVGSGSKPATSITFTTTLPSDAEVASIEAKFGGFNGTAGTVSLKVGDSEVGSGSLNASNDVTVSSTTTAAGNVVTVSITGISKGVKCYNIKVGYNTAE